MGDLRELRGWAQVALRIACRQAPDVVARAFVTEGAGEPVGVAVVDVVGSQTPNTLSKVLPKTAMRSISGTASAIRTT